MTSQRDKNKCGLRWATKCKMYNNNNNNNNHNNNNNNRKNGIYLFYIVKIKAL